MFFYLYIYIYIYREREREREKERERERERERDIKIYPMKVITTFLHASKLFWLSYECNCMNGATNMFAMLSQDVKYRKKITGNYNSFEKMNPIKGLQSIPCQKLDQFFYPYFDILMTSASRMRSHRKVYLYFIIIYQNLVYQNLSLILKIFRKENLYFTGP